MKNKKIWIAWRFENDSKGKPTKVPYRISGTKASTTDSSSWSTYEDAVKYRSKFDGIGFCFDGSVLGVDLDHVLKDGNMSKSVEEFIHQANTYTEISPSKNGLHLLFNLTEPLTLDAHKKRNDDGTVFECYTEKRFFTYTEDPYKDLPVRTIDAVEALELLSLLGYPWKVSQSHRSVGTLAQEVVTHTDAEVLQLMFESKNGKEVQALYLGDTSKYNNDLSSADMALCNHLAFWTRKNFEQIERLWMGSPLGQREKTSKRSDYRNATVQHAIDITKEVYTPKKILSSYTTSDFVGMTLRRSRSGIPYNDTTNALIALKGHQKYASTIKYNLWTLDIEYNGAAITEKDIYDIQYFLQYEVGLNGITKAIVYEAIQKQAFDNQYDEARDWLDGLKWDGVSRLPAWLHKSCGVDADEYFAAIGQQWMCGMVRRMVEPGCVFDYVLTLVGDQGIGKTSFFRIIGGKWYKSHTENVDNKDFMLKLRGACLIDLDEGATLSRSDSIKIKSVITGVVDEYRAPYDRVTQKYPRRFVFSMSTNDVEPFRDLTGNRRYWVVRAPSTINFSWLEENRDQLFAEAYHLIKSGAKLLDVPMDVAQQLQDETTMKDEWFNPIMAWMWEKEKYRKGDEEFSVSIRDIYEGALGGTEIHRMDTRTEMKIGNILRNDLKMIKKRTRASGARQNRFFLTPGECARLQIEYNEQHHDNEF